MDIAGSQLGSFGNKLLQRTVSNGFLNAQVDGSQQRAVTFADTDYAAFSFVRHIQNNGQIR